MGDDEKIKRGIDGHWLKVRSIEHGKGDIERGAGKPTKGNQQIGKIFELDSPQV